MSVIENIGLVYVLGLLPAIMAVACAEYPSDRPLWRILLWPLWLVAELAGGALAIIRGDF